MKDQTGQDSVVYCNSRIDFNIAFSRKRKTVSIAVYPSGEVKVSAPYRMSLAEVRRLVEQKAGWVDRKLREYRAEGVHDAVKKYVEGEPFLYMGKEYLLHLATGDHGPIVTLDDHRLNVVLPQGVAEGLQSEMAREAVFEWYRFHAEIAVENAMMPFCSRLGILPPYYRVKNLSRRWGSCTAKNLLNFNAKIVMGPLPQLEYVVAHELCHVKIKDHSSRFWALMETVAPGYKAARSALRKDGWKYEL